MQTNLVTQFSCTHYIFRQKLIFASKKLIFASKKLTFASKKLILHPKSRQPVSISKGERVTNAVFWCCKKIILSFHSICLKVFIQRDSANKNKRQRQIIFLSISFVEIELKSCWESYFARLCCTLCCTLCLNHLLINSVHVLKI